MSYSKHLSVLSCLHSQGAQLKDPGETNISLSLREGSTDRIVCGNRSICQVYI